MAAAAASTSLLTAERGRRGLLLVLPGLDRAVSSDNLHMRSGLELRLNQRLLALAPKAFESGG